MGIDAPIDIALDEESGVVGSPVAPSPSQALSDKLWIGFKGGLNGALRVVLNPRLFVFTDHPSGQKVVVIRVEDEIAPFFVAKSIKIFLLLQNLTPDSIGATGHAGSSTIKVVRGRDLEVAALDVALAEPVPAAGDNVGITITGDTLKDTHGAHVLILKRSKKPWKNSERPGNIIIDQDGDRGGDTWDGLLHLKTFVGDFSVTNFDPRVVDGMGEPLKGMELGRGGDKD